MYDLLLSSESDSDDCKIDIIATLSPQDLTKSNYLRERKTHWIYPRKTNFQMKSTKIINFQSGGNWSKRK